MDKNDSNSFEELVRAEQERQKKYEKSFKELREEAQKRQKNAKNFFNTLSEISEQLCSTGWLYLNSLGALETVKIKSYLSKNNISEIDSFFLQHFEGNLARFKDCLLKQNERRKAIIEEIFEGIEKELYYLVIPTIIGQIDGITEDRTTKRFFKVKKGEPHLKEYVASKKILYFTEQFTHAVNTIWEFSRRQLDDPSQMNRHDIIHGSSVDYGNKLVCFKYLSVLLFVSESLDMLNFEI